MAKKIFLFLSTIFLITACAGGADPKTEITLDLMDFSYSSPSITVTAGQPVLLTLENKGLVEHDFVIEKVDVTTKIIQDSGSEEHQAHGVEADFDFHVATQVDETSIVQFTILEPGTYTFFCSVEGHKEAGMIGELTVLAEDQ